MAGNRARIGGHRGLSAAPLRILMSRQAAAQLATPVRDVLGTRPHVLVTPDEADAMLADIASREQQTPEGLAAVHKAEIDKWWPIIKAAGIKPE